MTFTEFKALALKDGLTVACRSAILGHRVKFAQVQLWTLQFKKQYHIVSL